MGTVPGEERIKGRGDGQSLRGRDSRRSGNDVQWWSRQATRGSQGTWFHEKERRRGAQISKWERSGGWAPAGLGGDPVQPAGGPRTPLPHDLGKAKVGLLTPRLLRDDWLGASSKAVLAGRGVDRCIKRRGTGGKGECIYIYGGGRNCNSCPN